MHSGQLLSPQDFRSLPLCSPNNLHQEPPYSSPSRPGRLSTFRSGAEWNLEAPSDADLDDEQHLSAALLRAEGSQTTSLHSPHTIPSAIPIPMPPSNQTPQNVCVSPAAMFLAAFSPSMKPTPFPDDEGQTVAGYTLGSIIGYGGSSIIRRAFSASGGMVAIKIVKRSEIQKQPNPSLTLKKLQHEAEVWGSLSHEHIIPLFAADHTSYADFFVTLYCPAGSLYDILKRDGTPALPQDDAGMMFRQVVRGLRYLHEVAMYVHRDIKLENVLVDEMGVCRIGDFGMSRKIDDLDGDDLESDAEDAFRFPGNHVAAHRAATISESPARRHARLGFQPPHGGSRHRNSTSSTRPTTHACQPGSLPYASPELLLPQTHGPLRPHPAQDIWALGVMLYALLTGRFPFWDSFEPRLQMKILQGTFELPPGVGKGAERVLQGCLEKPMQQRWSISMVDEVAWGIGWGSEGDDVTPSESDDEFDTHCRPSTRPTSRSHSHSRPPPLVVPHPNGDSPHDDGRSRHVREAASRRSASRAKRSQSRAPVPYSGRSLSRGVVSRHNSRAPSPSSSGLSASIISDSPFLPSPTSPMDRGRRLYRRSPLLPSRSPSPGTIPRTPIDFGAAFSGPFSSSLSVVDDQPDELSLNGVEEEEKRGRSKSTREIGASPLSFSASDSFSDNDNVNITASVSRDEHGHWGGDEITREAVVDQGAGNSDCHRVVGLGASSEKERSRSCGHSLNVSSLEGTPVTRPLYDSRRHSHYQHYDPYEYDHEFLMRRRNKRTGSSPPTPSNPWSATSIRSPTGNPQTAKSPLSATIINELLRMNASMPVSPPTDRGDHVEIPAITKRGRSVDRGIGWS